MRALHNEWSGGEHAGSRSYQGNAKSRMHNEWSEQGRMSGSNKAVYDYKYTSTSMMDCMDNYYVTPN